MAALNLKEQQFIRDLARELGKSEAAVETALQMTMVNIGYRSVVMGLGPGGLAIEVKDADLIDRPRSYADDFSSALQRLGR